MTSKLKLTTLLDVDVSALKLPNWSDYVKVLKCRCQGRNYLIECACGCGEIRFRIGHHDRLDRPSRFIRNHGSGGYEHPSLFGSDNHAWRGDKVKYSALHGYVRKRLPKPKPDLCVNCKRNPTKDIFCTADKQTRNLDDWVWLCRSCIMHIQGRKSHTHTEATKAKISKTKRERKFTHTEASKEKMSRAKSGKKLTKEHKKNIGRSQLGRIKSEAEIEKIRKALTGKKFTKERKQNISKALSGRKQSKEERENQSRAQLRRWKKFRETQRKNKH